MNVQQRAMRQAASRMVANPMATPHALIRHANVVQQRRAAAFEKDHDTWCLFDVASQVTKAARPLTDVIDAVFGDGTHGAQVARPGHLSDGLLPCLSLGVAWGSVAVGHAVGRLAAAASDNPQAAIRGAEAGALVGCLLAWCATQAFAAAGLCIKALVLAVCALIVGVRVAADWYAPTPDKFERDAALYIPAQATREASGALAALKENYSAFRCRAGG